ncbi:MAG: hypothetical protein J0H66_05995 [Solirubrobacterales bacterium]|nr:hypothetical protein [Solirubrobacterales bacterium]OJU95002.1 MAG: hypothetical protein BGO23_07540 [Solirubrobacterales bacterium 67-14]
MPLSEDSRALLQLLLGRGKSYADISGLLGIDEAEVRRRAGVALAEVDDSVPAPDQELTDYLLGQADEISRADIGNRISSDPATAEQAESLTDQLRLLVPGATLPKPGSAEGGKPKPAPKAAAPAASSTSGSDGSATKKSFGGFSSITGHQRRLIAVLLGGALLAAVVILLVTGVIGGGSDDEPETPKSSPTVAVLQPVDGSAASGQVQFGFSGTALAANLQINDLKPSEKGQGYAIWLYGSTGAFPIHAQQVGKSGSISGQIQVNEAVICLIASDFFPTLRVSRVDNGDFNKALKNANLGGGKKNLKLPDYTGKTVLEGEISMPQNAKDTIVPVCNGSAQSTQ